MENKQICKKIIKEMHLKKIQGKKGTASTVAVVIQRLLNETENNLKLIMQIEICIILEIIRKPNSTIRQSVRPSGRFIQCMHPLHVFACLSF